MFFAVSKPQWNYERQIKKQQVSKNKHAKMHLRAIGYIIERLSPI